MIAPLTGVRAFAALWVVFAHLRGGVAGQLAAILVAAIAAHVVIENPARRRLRRWVAPV